MAIIQIILLFIIIFTVGLGMFWVIANVLMWFGIPALIAYFLAAIFLSR